MPALEAVRVGAPHARLPGAEHLDPAAAVLRELDQQRFGRELRRGERRGDAEAHRLAHRHRVVDGRGRRPVDYTLVVLDSFRLPDSGVRERQGDVAEVQGRPAAEPGP